MGSINSLSRRTLDNIAACLSTIVSHVGQTNGIALELRSFDGPSPICFVHKSDREKYILYLPMGLPQRLFVICALLRFSTIKGAVRAALAHTDKRERELIIPERLKCVFAFSEPFDESVAVELLVTHCPQLDLRAVSHLVNDAVILMVFHEMGHITRGHVEFRNFARKHRDLEINDLTIGMSEDELNEGFEVSADQAAAELFSDWVAGRLAFAKQSGSHIETVMADFAASVAAVVCLFDPKSRSLDKRGKGGYPHPLVRYSIINQGVAELLQNDTELGIVECGKRYWMVSRNVGMFVSTILSTVHFKEIEHDLEAGCQFEEDLVPICPLRFDQSPFNESVFFEHLIQSSERGRRIDLRIGFHPIFRSPGLSSVRPEFYRDAGQRWADIFSRAVEFGKRREQR